MSRDELIGMAGAAAIVPATLAYFKYGRGPAKRIGQALKKRLKKSKLLRR